MSRNQREGNFDGKNNGRFCRLSPEKIKSLREFSEFIDNLNMEAKQADDGPDERKG